MRKNIVLTSVMLLGLSASLNAATSYGTDVDNSASLTFSVGGVAQTTPIVSNTETFKVDRKVDLLIVRQDATNVSVVPGQVKAPKLTFRLTNETNGDQRFKVDLTNRASGSAGITGTDNFEATNLYLSTAADCTGSNLNGTVLPAVVGEGTNLELYVCGDIPAGQINGDISGIELLATAYTDDGAAAMVNTVGADDKDLVDIVLADGAGINDADHDGKFTDFSAFQVITATMTVAKSSCVVWDPINLTTNPKRIPGSVLRYAIQATNNGDADATSVALTDTLVSNLAYGVGTSGLTAVARVAEEACNCASPGVEVAGTTVSNSGQDVTVDYATVGPAVERCAYFDVTLN